MFILDDDFLDPQEVVEIRERILDPNTPWILTRELVSRNVEFNVDIPKYKGSQFNHILYIGGKPRSELYDMALSALLTFCNKHDILVYGITRCKINVTFPDSESNVEDTQAPHVDHSWPHYVFLYYVNEADGDTILYNEEYSKDDVHLTEMERVSPKAGRAILFDGLNYHSPLAPTKGYRVVINLTFVGGPNESV
jgi:hypothetical protein